MDKKNEQSKSFGKRLESIPDKLWEAKYKAAAEAYDKKEIPGDNLDLTTKDISLMGKSSDSHVNKDHSNDV